MVTLAGLAAGGFLFLTVASLLVVGGVLFALFPLLPLFALALASVLAGLPNRSVRRRDASLSATEWREGEAVAD